ncbi:MAG: ribosome biogenesis GTPase YlqF [Ruminococcaceae bacterium]|nr:ribosome biogenesis GTPase YlqF [Oscillospiraceae bacterium]
MNIQWFPGHMAKTRRLIQENIKMVDLVVELIDARAPVSSMNPELGTLCGAKPRLLILNKSDLASSEENERWLAYYKQQGRTAMLFDSVHQKNAKAVTDAVKAMLSEQFARQQERGMKNRAPKLMIVGIPNVGKSSFINRMAGRAAAISGDRPGVTKGKQWIHLASGLELLDTPGVLWPKFEDETVGLHLAFTGAIKDEIMDVETLAAKLLECLLERCPEGVVSRYKLSTTSFENGFEALEAVARKRGFIISGGEVDIYRAAHIVLDEFRSTKIGRITLESPEGAEQNEPC